MPAALIVDAWPPTPDRDAASLRLVNVMSILRDLSWAVTFAADDTSHLRPESVEILAKMGVRFAGQAPTSVTDYLQSHGAALDLVVLSRFHAAIRHIALVRRLAPRAKVVFDTTDLAFVRGFRGAKVTGNRSLLVQAMQAKRDELTVARQADCTWVVSREEQEVLRGECPGVDVRILSLVHEIRPSVTPFADRRDLMFVGSFPHHPNVDAMRYYLNDIHPLLEERLGGATTFVVGSKPPDWLEDASSKRLVVTGHVPDLTPYLDRCRLTIAPLRYGAGVKGKVVLSMSQGLPVVASTIALEGIPATPGEDVLVGDDPQSFVRAVDRLYREETLWKQLSDGGRRVVEEHFSFAAARKHLLETLEALELRGSS